MIERSIPTYFDFALCIENSNTVITLLRDCIKCILGNPKHRQNSNIVV